jgi:hypothetical protein
MNWNGPEFVVALVLISTIGWLASSWIRARHGYPVDNEWRGSAERSDITSEGKVALLSTENGQLKEIVGRLEERIGVLERIATDKGGRLTHETEALR